MNILERVLATQKTIDHFNQKPFVWGEFDCGQLAFQHLENMGLPSPLSTISPYSTEREAQKEIVRLKAKSMEDIIDAMGFERIAPASALCGDIVGYPGGDETNQWTSLAVAIGNGAAIGFALDICQRGVIDPATVAWRVV